ncbi:MAG TPA: aspartate dehydrogenase [Casimicrobiaceae bacterium]|nr:aspartate dehydrogenase [Casimicrobiaceae bacterium]
MKRILLIGYGAMGRTVARRLYGHRRVQVSYILERPQRLATLRREVGDAAQVIATLDEMREPPDFALECAGHGAVRECVPQLLASGIRTIVASIGALAHDGVAETLERSADRGGTQLVLVPGAIAGIDALAAARLMGLDEVRYVGRKPPLAWLGTPAEAQVQLEALSRPTPIFEGNALTAAQLYPKNANVAAMVALAGLGLERTRVSLVADPAVTRNTHSIEAHGAFGRLDVTVSAEPMPDNPKTSALAAYSVVRAVLNEVDALVR